MLRQMLSKETLINQRFLRISGGCARKTRHLCFRKKGMDDMNSLWSKAVQLPHFEALQESKKTDVLIIGGGMAGILCAFFL